MSDEVGKKDLCAVARLNAGVIVLGGKFFQIFSGLLKVSRLLCKHPEVASHTTPNSPDLEFDLNIHHQRSVSRSL
jgi:hypothetical protein